MVVNFGGAITIGRGEQMVAGRNVVVTPWTGRLLQPAADFRLQVLNDPCKLLEAQTG